MPEKLTNKVVGLLAVSGWGAVAVATSEAGPLVALAEPFSGGAILASGLALQLRESRRDTCADALQRIRKEVERETRRDLKGHVENREAIEELFDQWAALLSEIKPSVADLVETWRFDPELIAKGLVGRFLERSETTRENHVAHQLVERLIVRAVVAVKDDPDLYRKLEPATARLMLAEIGETLNVIRRVETTGDDTNERVRNVEAMMRKLIARSEDTGDTLRAAQAGVKPEAVIELARRISAEVDDVDAAFRELENAVEVAIAVQAEGRRGTNTDDFVDEVLRRIAELSGKGLHDDAAAEADAAFARWEREEAERRDTAEQAGLKLLEAGLNQDILRRDAPSAARRVFRRVELTVLDPAARFEALRAVQDEWFVRGRDKGLNLDLAVSIEIAHIRVARAVDSDEKGAALNDLGNALQTLGARESGIARLEEAVVAHRDALAVRTRERVPFDWAATQNNLGLTLATIGGRESGTERLEEAVGAYDQALQELTRWHAPLDWAATQINLGNALTTLGEREKGTTRLKEAAKAYHAALQEYTRERAPLHWATAQNNLGNALRVLGERETGTESLEEAVSALREALLQRTRERVPLQWAETQCNLGNALLLLGQRETETTPLEEAVEAYCAALQEYTRERVPLAWAATQNNLGTVLLLLGQRDPDVARLTTRLEEGVKAFREALRERIRERVPLDWAATHNNLGNALVILGEHEPGTKRLKEAEKAYRAALLERTRERVPLDWAMTQFNLGNALLRLSEREVSTARLEQAVEAYRTALLERTRERVSFLWAQTQENLAFAFLLWFGKTGERQYRKEALVAVVGALEVYREAMADYYIDKAQGLRAAILAA